MIFPTPKVLCFWAVIIGLGLLVGHGYLGSSEYLFLIPIGLAAWAVNDLRKKEKYEDH